MATTGMTWKIATLCGCAAGSNGQIDYCREHAAAPEMLKVLRACIACGALGRDGADANAANALGRARALLAKIEGRA